MAIQLQRQFSLPVVRVGLTQDASGPSVLVELYVNQGGESQLHGSRTWSLQSFSGGRASGRDTLLAVPDELVAFVAEWVTSVLEPGRALWLHLVKPYGVLGAVPWERALVDVLDRPVIRLPDVLPDAVRPTSTVYVAVIATAPAAEGPPPDASLGGSLIHALDKGLHGRMHVDVFVDAEVRSHVEAEIQGLDLPPTSLVHVHNPLDSPPGPSSYGPTSSRPARDLRSGWLRWVRDSLGTRSVDAVHFMVHGSSLGPRGAILTPLEIDGRRDIPIAVEAVEVDTFLTQVGALVCGFTRLPDNWSDHGLRQVADELGSRRAGPVLLHDLRPGESMDSLIAAYDFLTSTEPSRPPRDPALTYYAQPRQVLDEEAEPPPAASSYEPSPTVRAVLDQDETPTWLAAAQRYLEQQEGDLIRFQSETRTRTPTAAEVSHYQGVESALVKAHEVIGKYVEGSR